MKNRLALIFSLCLLFSASCLVARATTQEGEVIEETSYAFGSVTQVDTGKIMVHEFDYDTGEGMDITYIVDGQTVIRNADSLDAIAVSSNVDIDYVVKDSQKIARIITVEVEAVETESEVPEEMIIEEDLLEEE